MTAVKVKAIWDIRRAAWVMAGVLGTALGVRGAGAQQWIVPTPEELSMTQQDGAPGAPAVYLYEEQTTDDSLHMYSFYVRLKVLTEGGKDRANVELPYLTGRSGMSIDSLSGRTIHSDGTVVPFTGKPYDKLVDKTRGEKLMAKVFTLPSVEVGSILEYRFKLRYDDNAFFSPDWSVQEDLYVRKAHYMWRPYNQELMSSDGKTVSRIAWLPVLPKGFEVKQSEVRGAQAGRSSAQGGIQLELDVHDIPALTREKLMAPPNSLAYRVMFYYTPYRSLPEFWAGEGKTWSKQKDRFIGPGSGVKAFVAQTVAPTDTPEQKLNKLYDAVMTMENTAFTRAHTSGEDRSQGLKQVNSTDDVLARKRGSDDQMADLFVAMARAAGFKAYVMSVSNRRRRVFISQYQSLSQLDDDVAIVQLDGKEVFFDPGQRFCEFGHMSWVHAGTGGLRQTEKGTELSGTPESPYKAAHVTRTADLKLDEHGVAKGTVSLQFSGDPALHWRQQALRGDDASLNMDLKAELEHMLPGGMDVRVVDVKNLADYSKPLAVNYEVEGALATSTGKRLLVPAYLFAANMKPLFPEAKREQVVWLDYGSYEQEAVRYTLPAGMVVESAPKAEKLGLENAASFSVDAREANGRITIFRNLLVGKLIFPVKEYTGLRDFYVHMESKNQDPLVLIQGAPAAASASKPAGE